MCVLVYIYDCNDVANGEGHPRSPALDAVSSALSSAVRSRATFGVSPSSSSIESTTVNSSASKFPILLHSMPNTRKVHCSVVNAIVFKRAEFVYNISHFVVLRDLTIII